jgi:hypothetical protein
MTEEQERIERAFQIVRALTMNACLNGFIEDTDWCPFCDVHPGRWSDSQHEEDCELRLARDLIEELDNVS